MTAVMRPAIVANVEPTSPGFSRFVLGVLSACNLVFAWGTATLPYIDLSWAWAALFALAAVMCGACALRFDKTSLVTLTGPVCIVACIFRAGALVMGRLSGLSDFPWAQIIPGATLWFALAFCLFVMFSRGIVPLSVRQRAERRA